MYFSSLRTFTLLFLSAFTVNFSHAEDIPSPQPTQGPVKLDPPGFHVKIKPELLGQHPRIFFTAAELPAILQKLKDPRLAPMMKWFIADADRTAATPVPADLAAAAKADIRHNEPALEQLAFAYLLTGDQKYLTAWRKLSQAVLSWKNWDNDLGEGHLCFALAVTYDWLYHDLTPDERKQIETTVLMHGRDLLRDPVTHKKRWWNTAYFQNHSWINHTGISTAAMAFYDVYPQEMQTWLDDSRTVFQTTYENIGLDGGYHEGAAYARYGTTWMLYYIDSLRHMTGENLFDMPFLNKVGNYFCQTLMPDWENIANFGDCPSPAWTRTIEDQILVKLAAEYHDGHMMELRVLNHVVGKADSESPFALIWVDPSVEPKPLDDLPLVGLFPDLGLVVSRTSWKSDAAVVALHCGAPGGQHLVENTLKYKDATPNNGHTHPDANSFVFWADHAWRIGLPGAYTYLKATHDENTWLVSGKGQRGDNLIWFEQRSYMGRPDQAHLVTVSTSPQADYLVGEAAPAYDDEVGLTQFTRHLLFIKGPKPYVVTYDQLAAKTPQTWASYLHTYTKITSTDDHGFLIDPAKPGATPSFGSVFGPGKVDLTAQPLMVLREHTPAPAQHGFELAAAPEGSSDSTWLITVVGVGKENCSLVKPGPAPEIKVGADDIAWTAGGDVSLNGNTITGNLMPQAPSVTAAPSDDSAAGLAGEPTPPPDASPIAGELLSNPSFDAGLEPWECQKLEGTQATFEVQDIENGKHALHITVPAPAEKRYYVQFSQSIYSLLSAGKTYTLSFRAKSNPAAPIVVMMNASQASPGQMLKVDPVNLTTDWADYSYNFTPAQDTSANHLIISGLAGQAAEYGFTNFSLHESAGTGAPPATSNPPPSAPHAEATPATLPGAESFVYRNGTPDPMRLHVFKPSGWRATDHRVALVFFFGGGWTHGTPASAAVFPRRAAALGMVGIAPDYRTKARFGTSPLESVADSRAAFRWVQDHAAELGIDPSRIVVGGHSAGGHVALWTAISKTPPGSDGTEAPLAKPAALFLLSPVSDTSRETGYTSYRFGDNALALSPRQQLDGKMPPTLLMHADTDEVVPYAESVALHAALVQNGAVCDFVTVPHGTHSFPWQTTGWGVDVIMDRLVAFLKTNGVMTDTMAADAAPAAKP